VLDHNLTLKSDELFLVGNIETDGSRERATGLYVRDTRHLHRFRVTINGERPEQLQDRLNDPAHATVISANPLLTLAGGILFHPQQLLLEQRVGLDDALTLAVIVRNYGKTSVEVTLSIEMGADFRDLFDIRGFQRDRRGTCVPPRIDPQGVVFGYAGLDGGAVAETEIRFDRDAEMTEAEETAGGGELVPRIPSMSAFVEQPALGDIPSVTASFAIRLAPGSTWDLTAAVTPRPANGPPIANARARDDSQGVSIVTSDEQVNRVFRRCLSDLEALHTTFPHGSITAAGIPWFVAPFGRDSLIVGLQTLHLMPERAMGTLRMLAALQGEKVNQEREE